MSDSTEDLDNYEYIFNHYGLESLEKIGHETGKSVNAIKQIVARLKSRGELAKNEKEHAKKLIIIKSKEIDQLQSTLQLVTDLLSQTIRFGELVLKERIFEKNN